VSIQHLFSACEEKSGCKSTSFFFLNQNISTFFLFFFFFNHFYFSIQEICLPLQNIIKIKEDEQ